MNQHPVDLVYLWVNGGDPEFQSRKRQYMSAEMLLARSDDELTGDDTRYSQMQEIVYSVRSARLFAPWIRRVYIIVSDGQVAPEALLAIPDVSIVHESQIMPAEILPTFASPSIEPFMHRIPDLSEIFIYGNDDYFFWKVTPLEYFVEKGQLRLRGRYQPKSLARLGSGFHNGHMRIANRTALLLYSIGFKRVYMPEHSFHVFRKATCAHVWSQLGEFLGPAVALKFRDADRALFWQMLVDAYETQLHQPCHVFSLNSAHLSFADVDRSNIMSIYVRVRLRILTHFPQHTVCFNTIPSSWYRPMHRYFEERLGKAEQRSAEV